MNIILSFIYNEISIKKHKHIENGVKNIMNKFKIGGIYTYDILKQIPKWTTRVGCVVIKKSDKDLTYFQFILNNDENTYEKINDKLFSFILDDLIYPYNFKTVSIETFKHSTDGYLGQVSDKIVDSLKKRSEIDENIIEKFKKLSKNFFE